MGQSALENCTLQLAIAKTRQQSYIETLTQMPRWSTEVKSQVVALRDAKHTFEEISLQLKVPVTSCHRIYANYQQRGTVGNISASGRPRKMTVYSDRSLSRLAQKHRRFSAMALMNHYNEGLPHSHRVSINTVRRSLYRSGFRSRPAAKKLRLTFHSRWKRF